MYSCRLVCGWSLTAACCRQDAGKLAQKVVSNYGMSDLGITVHAPPAGGAGFQRKSYEVGQ